MRIVWSTFPCLMKCLSQSVTHKKRKKIQENLCVHFCKLLWQKHLARRKDIYHSIFHWIYIKILFCSDSLLYFLSLNSWSALLIHWRHILLRCLTCTIGYCHHYFCLKAQRKLDFACGLSILTQHLVQQLGTLSCKPHVLNLNELFVFRMLTWNCDFSFLDCSPVSFLCYRT